MDAREYNRNAWNKQVDLGNFWTQPVSAEVIERARQGTWSIVLTPIKPVPLGWFPPLSGTDVLCLASGGGQQGPVLSAVGANVVVFDNSPKQLARDRMVAERDGLSLTTVEGDMRDLSVFPDGRFDLIFHPVSNNFVPDVLAVWREAYRVLRPGGVLLSGMMNPVIYIFDLDLMDHDKLVVKNKLPYSDLDSLSEEQKAKFIEDGDPFEFSHTLEELIGGQIAAGFLLAGFYEDRSAPGLGEPLAEIMADTFATRAVKPH